MVAKLGHEAKVAIRWRIGTGSCASDAFTPSNHAHKNNGKMFKLVLDRFAYNAWKIQQSTYRRLRGVPVTWRNGQTWKRFIKVTTKMIVRNYPVARAVEA